MSLPCVNNQQNQKRGCFKKQPISLIIIVKMTELFYELPDNLYIMFSV